LRNKLLVAENKKLRTLLAKIEVESVSLKNENRALKKQIEAKAREMFVQMLGDVTQRANTILTKPTDQANNS
jgi:hypothetical protein